MVSWFAAFSVMDRIFILSAALGAIAVMVRLVLLVLGGAMDWDDLDSGDVDGHGDAGHGFHVLSVHGLSSFFLMFGLVGIALSRQSRAGMGLSLLGGIVAGLAAIAVIARLFRFAHGLQSSGNVNSQAAAGCLGTVYLRIPPGGTGRVTVKIGQRLREMDAIHAAGTELPTGTPVRVVRVDQSLAIVQPLSATEA